MHRYDRDSGLVFSEEVMKVPKHRSKKWHLSTLGQPPIYQPPASSAPTLQSIAMRSVLCNLDRLEPETLKPVPSVKLQKIWDAVRRSQLDSLQVWKCFAMTGALDRSFVHSRTASRPRQGMDYFVAQITSQSFAWVAKLTLSSLFCTSQDLVMVSKITNLVTLYVTSGGEAVREPFNNHIIRAWSEDATTIGSLSQLQLLFVQGQSDITARVFDFISVLPALTGFCSYKCGVTAKDKSLAEEAGWRRSTSSPFMSYEHDALRPQSYAGAPSAATWNTLVDGYLPHHHGLARNWIGEVPVLNVRIGAPERPAGNQIRMDTVPSGIDDVLYFERISEKSTSTSAVGSGPDTKKRKIRHDKRADLGGLLSDLQQAPI